jgi:hypothetical protein
MVRHDDDRRLIAGLRGQLTHHLIQTDVVIAHRLA